MGCGLARLIIAVAGGLCQVLMLLMQRAAENSRIACQTQICYIFLGSRRMV